MNELFPDLTLEPGEKLTEETLIELSDNRGEDEDE